MTRFEEKLYLQSVFDAIDQVYKMKKSQHISSYEERLRASFNKLIIPNWYNHDYTATTNGLRKTKSHGHVPRVKRTNNDDTPDTSVSSSINSPYLSNGTHRQSYRHRSPSRSWSERPPLRHDSTTSSYDTNGSVINGRRSTLSNGSSTYAPGVQRVAQSSTWYKPRLFSTKITNGNSNGHSIEPPKPLPRYSKIDQEHIQSLDSKIENVRYPIKPRTMAQAQIPSEESFLEISSDNDVTITQKSPISQTFIPSQLIIDDNTITNLPRTNSLKSVSSEAESYRSAILPPTDKNLLATDSSSYASVDERCLSPSTASYHTARAGDTSSSSSITGYETPTPQLDDDDDDNTTLSSHSSLSDLSHAETLEPNTEDLDIVAVLAAEQKPVIIPSLVTGMENSKPIDTRSIENTNWYDGSMETCIQQKPSELREISNDEILREVDINAVGDEFYLFSRGNNTNDDGELLNSQKTIEPSKRIFTMDDKTSNDFHYSLSNDPFDFDNNNSSLMITNLDDILIDDDDDDYSKNRFLNTNSRRPIQEDILYEVEHENSFSDHSQNTSSMIVIDDKTSIKFNANIDSLTATDGPVINNSHQTSSIENEKQQPSTNDNNNILPIYILPPLYTTTTATSFEPSSSLHIDTNNNFQKWDSFINQFPHLSSPSAYTSKIRHRHYSVGSYYDNKTTTVTLHPNHPYYLLGSAPVSPLSRTSTTSSESHYHIHHSPIVYDNISLNALRRVTPFLDSSSTSNYNYRQSSAYRSSSLNREEKSRTITYTSPKIASKSVEKTTPVNEIQIEPTPIVPQPIISPPSTRTSSVAFPQYEIPISRPKLTPEIPTPTRRPLFEEELHRTLPPLPVRIKSIEKEQTQNIYQEIDSTSTDDDDDNNHQLKKPNADLQFIRGAIDRVFHFNGESTSDSSTYYEEVEDENLNQTKKSSTQYPAIEAVQRFYNHKTLSDFEKRIPTEQITNLDDSAISNSSISKKSYTHSPPITVRKKDRSKSSEHERASSEEVDDTLNDIEDVDYHDGKSKRQIQLNHSTHTSTENSSSHSSDVQLKTKKTSQETQTIGQQKPFTRTTVPPIDIVTEMVIEQDEVDDHNGQGQIDDVSGDMVIFYDDIEIVEHSTSSYSSETDSTSSSSHHYSKPVNTIVNQPPPPVPARTLKPNHLLNNNNTPRQSSPSTTNKTYELEKSLIRKKFDVNSVNDMLNRTENKIGPSVSHRHPSARHFVGKLNNDDSPLPPVTTNGHQRTPTKSPFSTLPTRSSSINPSTEKPRSIIADTNALVKQIQNSLSRNSLHDTQINSKTLSISTKDLRSFVSSTYSPSDENLIDDDNNNIVHIRQHPDDQIFKRQARLSKSFHNVSEYNSTDQYPKKENNLPSKSVENNLNETKQSHIPLNLTSVVTSNSFSALPNSDENARMLSMKWYTGQVSANSEICYNPNQNNADDLLYGYISTHSNREIQGLFARLQASNDARIHAALDDIRSRVAQFDASKSREDLHVFMRYLESRLRDLNNNKNLPNAHQQQSDEKSIKSLNNKDIPPVRQLGRQHLRSSGNIGEGINGHQPTPPRRASQSSSNQENPAVFDDMLNTVLGLPKKGVSALPQTYPSKREKPTPLIQTQITTNPTTNKGGRDIGKRLFESGTYKDPRLIYDGPKRKEKEERPLETSV